MLKQELQDLPQVTTDFVPEVPEQLELPMPELSMLQRTVARSTETFRLSAEGTSQVIGNRPLLSLIYYAPLPPGKAPFIVTGAFIYSLWQEHDGAPQWRSLANTWRKSSIEVPEYMTINHEERTLEINKKALSLHLGKQVAKYYLNTAKPAIDIIKPYIVPLSIAFTALTKDINELYKPEAATQDMRFVSPL